MIVTNTENIGSIIHSIENELINIGMVKYNDITIWKKDGSVQSCYAAGFWQDNYPWTDNTSWPV